jgi:cysteine synthase
MNEQILKNTIERCRERNIIIPTTEQMRNPDTIPAGIKDELKDIGLWDLNPRNLFRITWKNEPVKHGGGYGNVNYLEIPKELTGIKARILVLLGKYFPTGAHKVGAAFGCLAPRLVTGEFDPTKQKAVWPSTGNYCRGGAYDSYLLGCTPIAILPEEMSQERFDWLKELGSEVFATPGCESNVKEIYDKCHELKKDRGDDVVILNQFDEMGNPAWHYAVTGSAMEEAFNLEKQPGQRLSAVCLTQGSAGTLGAADYLKTIFPSMKTTAAEALQCPTLLHNGYGGHRIEGIGDKHVPWVHNVKNTDMVTDIDDYACIALMRLFNEAKGKSFLKGIGIPEETVEQLELLGISGIANLLSSIKTAKYYEFNENDIIVTTATDSMEMYQSRMQEYQDKDGDYTDKQAAVDYGKYLEEAGIDNMLELSYYDKRRMHNLKYFTWIEQQGKEIQEINNQWYDENYWTNRLTNHKELDAKINEFNERTGLLKKYS